MKIYYYDDVPNFGDMLNKYIWPHYFGEYLNRDDGILLFGIGTLLGFKPNFNGEIIVFGSGSGYFQDIQHIKSNNHIISFVRGPLTAKRLGLSNERSITDPAILTPEIFPAAKPTGRVVFVPHWETSFNPLWKTMCDKAGIVYLDPLSDVQNVTNTISGAKLVIAEAMHAAILADTYRVPWVPVSTSPRINEFKWKDWAASLEVELPAFNYLKPVGLSDVFRDFLHQASESYKNASKPMDQHSNLIKIYRKLITYKLHCRIEHRMMTKTGPFLDAFLNKLVLKNIKIKRIMDTVDQLKDLARLGGSLSNIDVTEHKRALIHVKIRELINYLDKKSNRLAG